MSKAISSPGLAASGGEIRPRKKRTKITPTQRARDNEGKLHKHWRTYFLAALVETSNVSAAAAIAGVSPSRVYKLRSECAEFSAQWRRALYEGYMNLEMEVLGYLRNPASDRKMDVTNALRLLSQHREMAAHERALADNRSEQDVLDSIDAMIDEMRRRAAANAALLAQDAQETRDAA